MEDTLCEMLCSVIPIQHNKNQRQPGHRPQIHLEPSTVQYQPQTLYSCCKNTAVHTHLRLYETADCHWKMSCRDLHNRVFVSKSARIFALTGMNGIVQKWWSTVSSTASIKGSFITFISIIIIYVAVAFLLQQHGAPCVLLLPTQYSKTSSATLLALMDPQKHEINTACISSRKILLLSILLYNGFHY